jgi:xyloglucan-specific exo-beta-1,4-glucanase
MKNTWSMIGLGALLAACNLSTPNKDPSGGADPSVTTPSVNKVIQASGAKAWDNLVQTGSGSAGGRYTASVRIKGAGEVTLRLFEGDWGNALASQPCAASSTWKTCSVAVTLGANPKFTFNISYSDPASTPILIDDATLTDSSAKNILLNSGFEAATTAPWWLGSSFAVTTETAPGPVDPPPNPTPTGAYQWKNVEVGGGGMVTGIVVHPKERNLVYARTDVGGVFRWNESAGRWTPLSDGFSAAQNGYFDTEAIAVDPTDPNVVFAAGGNGRPSEGAQTALLKSIDRGSSWRVLKTDLNIFGNGDWRSSGERLAVDPNGRNVVYFGSREQGLWRSTNGGSSWEVVPGLPKGDAAQGVGFVAFDPTSGSGDSTGSKRIWAGIAKEGVFQSDDAGATWRRVLEGRNVQGADIPGYLMGDVSVTARGTLYASFLKPNGGWVDDGNTPNGVYRLEAGSWQNISPDQRFNFDGLSAISVAGQDRVIVLPWDGNYEWRGGAYSEDGGRTWARIDFNDGDFQAQESWVTQNHQVFSQGVALDPFDPNRAWGAGGFGVWRSDNVRSRDSAGKSSAKWTTYSKGISETVDITAKSLSNGTLITGIADLSGFVYNNLDATPDARAAHQTPLFTYTSIDALSNDPNYLVAVGQDQIYFYEPDRSFAGFSTNGGLEWQRFPSLPQLGDAPARVGRIALGVGDKNNIVWAPAGSGVYATLDGGRTWKLGVIEGTNESFDPLYWWNGPFSNTYLNGEPLTADKVNPKTFYAYGNIKGWQTKLYRSTDGGLTWKVFEPFNDGAWTGGAQLRSKPGRAGELLLARDTRGLWRSNDGGQNFNKLAGVSRAQGVTFGKAAPGRSNPTIFLAGVVNGVEGIHRSDDDAVTWTSISGPANNVLTGKFSNIEGDVNVYGRVYVVPGGRGTFYGQPQ